MRLSSKPIVTTVEKQHLQHHQNQESKRTDSVRVTRIKSSASNSIKDTKNGTSTLEHVNMSSGNSDILPRDSMNINVDRPLTSTTTVLFTPFQSSSPTTGKDLQPTARSLIEENQNTKRIQTSVSFTCAAKITPLNDDNLTNTVVHPTQSPTHSNVNSKSLYDLRQIYTIGKERNIPNKRRQKLCQNQKFIRNLVLALILLAIIAVAIITPLVILLSKTTTTALTMQITDSSTTTSTETSTTSCSTTSSSSSSSTTSSMTTASTTTPVATVTITSNICTGNWSGIEMVANCLGFGCTPFSSYYRYVRNYTAIGTSSLIVFGLRRQTGYFAFDDVSVKSFAAPTVEILVNGGFETGDLTGWSYCNQNNVTNTGGVEANSTHFTYLGFTYYANSGSYYYIGGSLTSADYISQIFPTIIGEQYTIVIYYMNVGNGSLTSADLFLGV